MARFTKQEREEAITKLRTMLRPGDVLYIINKHTSRSGMSRRLSVHKITDADSFWLSRLAAKALGWGFDDKWGAVKVEGCGMDMGFHLVYTLGRVLFPDGFTRENGEHETDGGYALTLRWL